MRTAINRNELKRGLGGLLAVSLVSACLWGSSMARGLDEEASDSAMASGNAARGRLLFLQCRSCHSVEEGGMNKVGPNLYGVIGNQAAMAKDFIYSQELLDAGVSWTLENLDAWLTSPSDFIPGNRMIYSGVPDPQDRADIIAYLKEATTPAEAP